MCRIVQSAAWSCTIVFNSSIYSPDIKTAHITARYFLCYVPKALSGLFSVRGQYLTRLIDLSTCSCSKSNRTWLTPTSASTVWIPFGIVSTDFSGDNGYCLIVSNVSPSIPFRHPMWRGCSFFKLQCASWLRVRRLVQTFETGCKTRKTSLHSVTFVPLAGSCTLPISSVTFRRGHDSDRFNRGSQYFETVLK